MADGSRILVVDDDPDIQTACRLLLRREFDQVTTIGDPGQLIERTRKQPHDVILLDMNFGPGESSGQEGLYWLSKILEEDPGAVVIMITAHGAVETAVEAMKRGATDYVAKPWHNERLLATVSAAVRLRASRSEAARLKAQNRELAVQSAGPEQAIVGSSDGIRRVLSLVERAAPTDANVLILGENGTGKELVARALHRQSARAREVFISVDLGAVPEALFESELFGYRKGAFTGAARDRIGRLAAASGGTLFLDEIGNTPPWLQAKLLAVLEQRQVVPLGGNTAVDIDVRVVSATNLPPGRLRDEAVFRQDLLFRLNTVEIHLPPLRDRREDIPALVDSYLRHYERKYGADPGTPDPDALATLSSHAWPGNVRELRNAVERAVILASGPRYRAADFSVAATDHGGPGSAGLDDELNLARLERQAVEAALKKHRFNITAAAKELGLTRAALYRRMEKHGI